MDFKMAVKNGDFIRIDYTESVDEQVIATTDREVATAKPLPRASLTRSASTVPT